MSIEAIKKALEGVNAAFLRVLAEAPADAANYSIGLDLEDTAIRITLEDMRAISAAVPEIERLQRENDDMRQRLDIGPCGEDAIDVAESAADHLRHRAEAAEAEVKRLQTELALSKPLYSRRQIEARVKLLEAALKPFVSAFESRREFYSKRYPSNPELGYSNFDKMPDDWAMEKIAFDMGTYRRARTALASTGGEHHGN